MYKLLLSLVLLSGSLLRSQGGPASHVITGPNLPTHCNSLSGDIWFKTSGSGVSATGLLYICTAKDTWTLSSGAIFTAAVIVSFNTATNTCTPSLICSASSTAGTGSTPGVVITHSLSTAEPLIAGYNGSGSVFPREALGSISITPAITDIQATTLQIATISFNTDTTGTIKVYTGGGTKGDTGATGANGTNGTNGTNGAAGSGSPTHICEISVGDPDAASPVLVDGNDSPALCSNKYKDSMGNNLTLTIVSFECRANAGSPTVTPIITGGGATSILTGALTCGTGSFATGTLNGTPTMSFNDTIDFNITSAGGTAKQITFRLTRTQ